MGNEVILYLPEPAAVPLSGFHRMRVSAMRGPILRQIWARTVLPAQIRVDRLDLFWGPAHRLPPFLPPNLARVATIHDLVWVHAAETMHPRTRMGERAFMKSSVARADTVVTVSDATARDLVEAFPSLAKDIVTIHAGAGSTTEHSDPADLSAFGIDRPYVLFVGTLEPRKNLKRLLDAWKMLPQPLKDTWRLVIAGGKGWGMASLADEIEARSLGQTVLQTGYVSEAELSALYENASLLAMPSLYEGFGLPIVEANAYGVPALTSNLSSMPEIAGPDAILIDPHSTASIVAGLVSFMSGERDRTALSAAARANARRFDWNRTADRLMDVFERAISIRGVR